MFVIWFVFAIFAVMTAVLLSGHGGFLVAGYNTASPEERAKYDEKKICRSTGVAMLVITLMLFVMAVWGENMPGWSIAFFVIATLIICGITMFYANTKCFAKDCTGDKKAEISGGRKQNSKVGMFCLIFMVVVTVGVLILCFTGNIGVEYEETSFHVSASYWGDTDITYNDIGDMEFRENFSGGSRVAGFGSPRLMMGKFRNDEFGSYTRYTYATCDSCIVLNVKGEIVVINGKDDETTREIYEELLERKQ